MHITSLPAPYGVGTMGGCARRFVDFLQANWVLISLFALAAYAIDKLLKAIGFSRSNDSM